MLQLVQVKTVVFVTHMNEHSDLVNLFCLNHHFCFPVQKLAPTPTRSQTDLSEQLTTLLEQPSRTSVSLDFNWWGKRPGCAKVEGPGAELNRDAKVSSSRFDNSGQEICAK